MLKEYNADFYEKEYLNGTNSNYGESYFTEDKIKSYESTAKNIKDIFSPKRVLEIGCAYGYIVKFLNELGIEAHGVDISNYAIEHSKHKNCIKLDVMKERLPFEDNSFDLIIIIDVLEHFPEDSLDFVFSELKRVGSDKVYMFIPTIVYPGLQDREEYETEPSHINVPTLSHIIKRFEDADFCADFIQRLSFWDYKIILTKKLKEEIIKPELERNMELKKERNKSK
ncbi:MAG: methyltransferase domain-containing protein [Chloroflexi bacterium]|nr:methyltransferase domain-containing protein [Chloroflexota bacterium]